MRERHNNGKFDSYSLYSLYINNPTALDEARTPLQTRSQPMDEGAASGICDRGIGTSAALVGSSGWYKTSDGNLRRPFFVFAATVPITNEMMTRDGLSTNDFESFPGSNGFAAIEYQQDQARIPLTNNAVVYDGDLSIDPGAGIQLNGRIMTNGNLIIGQGKPTNPVRLLQVSSPESCFYTEDNGDITVGGNVVVSDGKNPAQIDLFETGGVPLAQGLTDARASVTDISSQTSYNSQAYAQRLNRLVELSAPLALAALPDQVQDRINNGVQREIALRDYFQDRTRPVPFAEVPADATLADALVGEGIQPPAGGNDLRPSDEWIYPVANNGLTLAPDNPPATDPAQRGPNEVQIGDRISVGNGLPAEWWENTLGRFVNFYDGQPQLVVDGDWTPNTGADRNRMTQAIPLADVGDTSRNGFWEIASAQAPNQPLEGMGGLRVITGAGVYSPHQQTVPGTDNSFLPHFDRTSPNFIIGDDFTTFDELENELDDIATPAVVDGFTVVMPDSMPMWEDTDNNGIPSLSPDTLPLDPVNNLDRRGDLVMRATAVYHYRNNASAGADASNGVSGDGQTPIACVSSYYNPTTNLTARNNAAVNALWAGPPGVAAGDGLSNNGISYASPVTTSNGIAKSLTAVPSGAFTPQAPPNDIGEPLLDRLNYQANQIFPDGRFVNESLRAALKQEPLDRNLAEQAAIDSTICALEIFANRLAIDNSVIPHGAIYETTFLDARQVKALEREAPEVNFDATIIAPPRIVPDYDLSVEERQPLEIRATVLDLDLLRKTAITGTSVVPDKEYLLPDSGIIYATRDDALLDLSAPGAEPPPDTAPASQLEADQRRATRELNSPVDFITDPTRRPNGIMLINGSILARGDETNQFRQTEKGLILATNLPAYVQADQNPLNAANPGFNLHQTPGGDVLEEFDDFRLTQNPGWLAADFYGRQNLDPNFACRQKQPGLEATCIQGDLWRSATVVADAVTLLSDNFRLGFRNEGDYDLRKNVDNLGNNLVLAGYDVDGNGDTTGTADETQLDLDLNGDGLVDNPAVPEAQITLTAVRLLNGFFNNNYLTSADSFDLVGAPNPGFPKDFDATTGAVIEGSSYVNNFVTPIQRRTNFAEYAMEICRKPLVSQCQPGDWIEDGTAGTTAQLPPDIKDRRYPRRVAFKRNGQHRLELDGLSRPTPIGVNGPNAYPNTPPVTTTPTALWFRTTNSRNADDPTTDPDYRAGKPLFYLKPLPNTGGGLGTTQQPLLVPVLQIHTPTGDPRQTLADSQGGDVRDKTWMQKPNGDTTFNLIMVAGDNPARDVNATTGVPAEQNGGMPNFPNLIENWNGLQTNISGSFIQFKRRAYATAPFQTVLSTNITDSIFGGDYRPVYYGAVSRVVPNKIEQEGGSPYYYPSNRGWGFDVGLLSQLPDLFSSLITTPSAGDPNEFYREVSRNDRWVNTLLCATVSDGGADAVPPEFKPGDCT
ncbi:MAG: hypothetical protein F6K41_13340 [Symploca sp. SIO3E6]|nr:hypothetical protein [Caldora sp. SIO3E6]